MSLPLICKICKKGSDIGFNYDIEELLKVNKDYSCYQCNTKNFNHLISKYNITHQNLFTKKEFKNSIWGEHITIMIIVLIMVIIILIANSLDNWNSINYGGVIILSIFFYIPFGSIAFIILKSIYKKFLKRIDLDNEYEKYCVKEKKSNERYLEYNLLGEIKKSFIDPKSLDINKIKSAIKFIKWSNESDDYFMVYGTILQLDYKFNEAIDVFKKVKYGDNRNSAFRLIADTYFQNKQYKNAISYYNKYQPILDSDRLRVESTISLCNTLIRVQKS